MNRPFLFVLVLAVVLATILGWFWLPLPTSNQELLANTAKALDYASGWKNVGGPPWWTPNFMLGTSLAPSISGFLTSAWLLVWTAGFGLLAGPKLAALACLVLATVSTYFFARRLTGDSWTAAACAVALLFCAPVYFRLIHVEHMVFVTAISVIPLVFLTLTIVLDEPNRLHGLICGLTYSFLFLTYAKAALLILPLAVAFAVAYWIWKKRIWRPPGAALLWVAMAVFLLAVLPNLPGLREMRLVTLFSLSPFEGWQTAFSSKSSLSWIDRLGWLTNGVSGSYFPMQAMGGSYLGWVPFVLMAIVLGGRKPDLYTTTRGVVFRLSVALLLLSYWFSFGPHGVLLGQMLFLKVAWNVTDPVVALSWLMLAGQGWVLFRLLSPQMPGRHIVGAVLTVIYMVIPGFRLLSWLPVYSDLRAPQDFFQVGGVVFLALATGCALSLLADHVRWPRTGLAMVLALVAALDVSPYLKPFFVSPMEDGTFQDFQAATTFLAEAPEPGSVLPISGRYFYLLTPHFSGRPLSTEAFNSYLMEWGVSVLQSASNESLKTGQAFWNLSGIRFVLIDKKDPDISPETQQSLRGSLPAVYENDHFVILKNANALSPAYLAKKYVAGTAPPVVIARTGLDLESKGAVILPNAPATYAAEPAKIGTITEEGLALDPGFNETTFQPVDLRLPRSANYQRISLSAPGGNGWIIIPEAFHPDWRASSASSPLNVLPANGAFLAVQTVRPDEPIELEFRPPWWYSGFLAISALGWIGTIGLIGVGFFAPRDNPLGILLRRIPGFDRGPEKALSWERPPIHRALVIIPTYNEAITLPEVLDLVLATDPRVNVLVVDDGSPDGTANLVRGHAQFENRVHLLPRPGKLGLGSAYKEGFHWGFERDFDACLEMDADLSHDPREIPNMLAALEDGADAAIGSRYRGGVRVMNWSESRLFLSTSASHFVRLVTGLPLTDATSGFKAIRTPALKNLDWSTFRAEGYGFQVELHHALWQSGAQITEVPIVFTERRGGVTKMTIGIAFEAAWRTIRLSLAEK